MDIRIILLVCILVVYVLIVFIIYQLGFHKGRMSAMGDILDIIGEDRLKK